MLLLFRLTITLAILLLSTTQAFAGYSQERIKKEIAKDEHFHVKAWEKTDSGNGWMSTDKTNHFIVGVTPTTASVMSTVTDHISGVSAIMRCNALGKIAMQASTENQKNKIFDSVTIWNNGNKNSLSFNGMKFETEMIEIGNSVILNCSATVK